MISIITLAILTLVATFIIKVPVFYFLIKLLNKKIEFLTSLKGLLFFEVLYFLFVCIYFKPMYSSLWLAILSLIGVILASGGLFLLVNHFVKIVNWKKSIILFILMFLIATPLISYFVTRVAVDIIPSENIIMPEIDMWDVLINPPLYQRFMDKIGDSMGNDILMQSFMSVIFNLDDFEMQNIEIEDEDVFSEISSKDDFLETAQGTEWEDYENKANGFSIENPGGLDIDAKEYRSSLNGLWLYVQMHLRHSELKHICATYMLEVRDSGYTNIEGWAKDYTDKVETPWNYEGIEIRNSVISAEDIGIQGRMGKKLVLQYGFPNPNIIFSVINGNKIYTLKFMDNTSGYERENCFDEIEEGAEYRIIFDELLSSIKFNSLIIEYPDF